MLFIETNRHTEERKVMSEADMLRRQREYRVTTLKVPTKREWVDGPHQWWRPLLLIDDVLGMPS